MNKNNDETWKNQFHMSTIRITNHNYEDQHKRNLNSYGALSPKQNNKSKHCGNIERQRQWRTWKIQVAKDPQEKEHNLE